MLESKLWLSKTETKNVKAVEMVGFIKTCDQSPHRFNFGHFFQLTAFSSPFCWGNRFLKYATWAKWIISVYLEGDDKNLGKSFVCGHE